MAKTSTAIKDRYNAKAYEDIRLRVKRGQKDAIKAYAESLGMSLNAFVVQAIEHEMEKAGE